MDLQNHSNTSVTFRQENTAFQVIFLILIVTMLILLISGIRGITVLHNYYTAVPLILISIYFIKFSLDSLMITAEANFLKNTSSII